MGDLAIGVLLIATSAVINAIALAASRSGATRTHQAMFWCGLAGLLSLPVLVASSLFLAMRLIVATLNSPPGYLAIASGAIGVVATVVSVFLLAKLRTHTSASHV